MTTSTNGYLKLFIGPMYASKTTHLLQEIMDDINMDSKKKILFINHLSDTRSDGPFSTHNKELMQCFDFTKSKNVTFIKTDQLNTVDTRYYDIILIDEAQFFMNANDLYDFCNTNVRLHNKYICVASLIADSNCKKFGSVIDLIPMSDEIHHLYAKCTICARNGMPNTPAAFTKKIVDNDSQIIIDVDDKAFIAVCRAHYN